LRRKCRRVRPRAKTRPSRRPGSPAVGEVERHSEQQIAPGRRTARVRRINRFAVAAEVLENPLNRCLLLDARDHPQLPAAPLAALDVDGKDTLETLCPGQRPLPVGGRYLAALLGLVGSSGPGLGYDPGPIRARRREHAVIARQVRAGLRHQRHESGNNVLGLEYDVRGAVPTVRPA